MIYVHTHQTKDLSPKAITKHIIECAHHAKIDPYQIGDTDDSPGSNMIQKCSDFTSIRLPNSTLTLLHIPSPFSYNNLFLYKVELPPKGPLGLVLENDAVFVLPIINAMASDGPFKVGCKKVLQHNSWLVGIHHEEPITLERFLEYVVYLRANNIFEMQVTLT